jgi:hypothetical protein
MSLRDAGNGIANWLTADTLASDIDSIAGSVVTLAAGQGVNWSVGDIVHLTGNNLPRVATGDEIDDDDLTLDRPPATTTIGAGAQVRAGFALWVRPASASEQLLYIEPYIGPDPLKVFEDPDGTSNCQARLRPLPSRGRISTYREQWSFELAVDGYDIEWCEGLLERASTRLRSRPTELTVPAHDGWNLQVDAPSALYKSTAGLCRYVMPIHVVIGRRVVA